MFTFQMKAYTVQYGLRKFSSLFILKKPFQNRLHKLKNAQWSVTKQGCFSSLHFDILKNFKVFKLKKKEKTAVDSSAISALA